MPISPWRAPTTIAPAATARQIHAHKLIAAIALGEPQATVTAVEKLSQILAIPTTIVAPIKPKPISYFPLSKVLNTNGATRTMPTLDAIAINNAVSDSRTNTARPSAALVTARSRGRRLNEVPILIIRKGDPATAASTA